MRFYPTNYLYICAKLNVKDMAKYKRILLKLSGESLMGENNTALTKKDWRNMPHKSKKSMNRSTNRHRYRRRKYLPWTKRSQQGLRPCER